jgi:ribosomal protein S6--L-glutamate ligase
MNSGRGGKKIWLVYDGERIQSNARFIELFSLAAAKCGAVTETVLAEALPEGELPDAVCMRCYVPGLSARFEAEGIRVCNNSLVSEICNDKYKTYRFLKERGLPVIDTVLAEGTPPEGTVYPAVVKTLGGHGGTGVYLANNADEAAGFMCRAGGERYIVQPYVECGHTDIRVYMLGGEVLAAVRRTARAGFRSNYSLGGAASAHTPTDAERRLAADTDRLLRFDYAAVDILYRNGLPQVNELEDIAGCRLLYDLSLTEAGSKYAAYIAENIRAGQT